MIIFTSQEGPQDNSNINAAKISSMAVCAKNGRAFKHVRFVHDLAFFQLLFGKLQGI